MLRSGNLTGFNNLMHYRMQQRLSLLLYLHLILGVLSMPWEKNNSSFRCNTLSGTSGLKKQQAWKCFLISYENIIILQYTY